MITGPAKIFFKTYLLNVIKHPFYTCHYAFKTNVNLQDWKYTLFKVFIPHSRNMRRHNANLMEDVVENIRLKVLFQI